MAYTTLEQALLDLEKNGHLLRVKSEVDPYLEMAAIHLRVFENQGPALLFENVKGTGYRCASNIFGTLERSQFLFRETFSDVQKLIQLKNNPMAALKKPLQNIRSGLAALKAFPLKKSNFPHQLFEEIQIDQLPQIHHWKKDGGAFITLPQVYTEDPDRPGIMQANLGMYRIQISGNDYRPNQEVGLHYQLHRGIGVHQSKANKKNEPLRVSCFVGGPPAHSLAAVMPLPEGMSEMTFAGLIGGRRFRYAYHHDFCISLDADFIITGTVDPQAENKPEGPFGDHLGYYSLTHPFPVLKVEKVWAKKKAIWPFTVVGRPPQEDTSFGALIHELTGDAIPAEIPGLKEVQAVDAAGVHPLLLAVGSERYTPYLKEKRPSELLSIANHILGTGQLSLAKYLFIAANDHVPLKTNPIDQFLIYCLERMDFSRDVHFYTQTSIDTLDYSGDGLNTGSKVVLTAYGEKLRTLCRDVPPVFSHEKVRLAMPGVLMLEAENYNGVSSTRAYVEQLFEKWKSEEADLETVALVVLVDDADMAAATLNNFLWVTFTRSNPAQDMYGFEERTQHKHWACKGPLLIDARKKQHHAPELVKDATIEKHIDRLFEKGAELEGWG